MNRRILLNQIYGVRYYKSDDSAASSSRSANQLSREQIDDYVVSAADGDISFLDSLVRGRRRIFIVGFVIIKNLY
jgi:hypothetical protein